MTIHRDFGKAVNAPQNNLSLCGRCDTIRIGITQHRQVFAVVFYDEIGLGHFLTSVCFRVIQWQIPQ